MIGAGPPAVTDARWYPSDAPLYRSRGGNASAMNAAWGPYWMSCTIGASTIANNTRPGTRVSRRAKYGQANSAIAAAPSMYVRLRPKRSDT